MKTSSITKIAFIAMIYTCSIMACPDELLLIRHAEKIEGTKQLSVAGKARAQTLPVFFMTPNPHFKQPTFVTALVDSSNRPRKTCKPTAEALGLKLNLNYSIPDTKNGNMARYLLRQSGIGLVCLEHTIIRNLVSSLTEDKVDLSRWPDNVFNRVIILHFKTVKGKCQFQYYENILQPENK